MDLNTFIVAVFCPIDDRLKDRGPLRQRGPAPKLSDAEVPTIEIVGEFLGIDTDKGIHLFFRRHYSEWLPLSMRCIGLPSPAKLPTSGRSKNASGKSSSLSLLTTRPSPSATLLPLPASLFARAYR
jgi:hypothetical protein